MIIDLRSDTVTRPTDLMRQAMASADVGDDVYGEDPTVNKLQEKAADLFGKEAALFMPSGTMGNQICVKLHTNIGDEVIIEDRGHILNYELGGASAFANVTLRPVKSADGSGHLTWEEISSSLRLAQAYYSSSTKLICLENTHNFAGGSVMSAEHNKLICDNAHELGLAVHMDGARIFNASASLQTTVAKLTEYCDSVQFCLSKGLGAPVGSLIVGSKDFIAEARVWRKRLGGGMRQAGILAAAGIVALDETPKTLPNDHSNARRLARGLANISGISIDPETVATNIVIFDISATGKTSDEITAALAMENILCIGFGNAIRMVTHYDISTDDIDRTITTIYRVLKS